MNLSVILAHPKPGSFNHAIAAACVDALESNGHEVYFHDLYKERFDSHLPPEELYRGTQLPPVIERHCAEVAEVSGIIIIHPNWWGQPPAILKGWIDRVIRPGVAYEFIDGDSGEGIPKGLLKARSAIVLNTSNTNSERERNTFGDPLELIWKNCVFRLCGVHEFHRVTFSVIVTSTKDQREAWLSQVSDLIDHQFPKAPNK